ncbi:MAG: MBL fold metallo-hydrolase [Promethearchaeota archaeon]|jgi:glyoxylase-like metal-dependent hydrolase (beta-lactamase superfamily II)
MMFFSKDESEKIGKEVIKNLFFFSENQMLDCNQYIIKDKATGELILFDAGNGISLAGLFKGMKKLNLNYENITKVFLTHEHVDHVVGIYKLIQELKDNPPEIFAYGTTTKVLEVGDETKILPIALGITARRLGVEIFPLKVNDLKQIKNIGVSSEFNFQIHYTPGHSPGSICYYEPDKKILIPGDLIFKGGSFGRFDFPGGSLKTLINSIKYVKELDVKYLLPGHMGISENGNKNIELSYRMIESMGSFY